MNSKARKIEHLVAKFANERRASRGIDRLDSDRALTAAAREHSRDMAKRGEVFHFHPDRVQEASWGPSDRVKKYDIASENCYRVHGWDRSSGEIAGDALDGWMTSKDHRENMLKWDHVRQGVGVWKGGDWVYFTQMFVPRSAVDDPKYHGSRDDPIGDFLEDVKRRLPVG